MPAPWTWNVSAPDGTVDSIRLGDDELRTLKTTLKEVFQTGPISNFPTDAHCTRGWPRVLVAATVAGLPAAATPYGRLAYVSGTGFLYAETATGWIIVHPASKTVTPVTGLTGDGFLANPAVQSCGGFNPNGVQDFYQTAAPRPVYKGLFVGVDPPCGQNTVYRIFLRFPLAGLPSDTITTLATLRLRLKEKASPTADCRLHEIEDFGTLEAADWAIALRADLGVFVADTADSDETQPDRWVSADVTTRYKAAKQAGLSHLAFRLVYATEGESPGGLSKWYGFVSADEASERPELIVRVI